MLQEQTSYSSSPDGDTIRRLINVVNKLKVKNKLLKQNLAEEKQNYQNNVEAYTNLTAEKEFLQGKYLQVKFRKDYLQTKLNDKEKEIEIIQQQVEQHNTYNWWPIASNDRNASSTLVGLLSSTTNSSSLNDVSNTSLRSSSPNTNTSSSSQQDKIKIKQLQDNLSVLKQELLTRIDQCQTSTYNLDNLKSSHALNISDFEKKIGSLQASLSFTNQLMNQLERTNVSLEQQVKQLQHEVELKKDELIQQHQHLIQAAELKEAELVLNNHKLQIQVDNMNIFQQSSLIHVLNRYLACLMKYKKNITFIYIYIYIYMYTYTHDTLTYPN